MSCPGIVHSVWPCLPAQVNIDDDGIMGIPQATRDRIVNVLRVRMDVDKEESQANVASRKWDRTWTFWNQTSITQYQQQFIHQVEASGMQAGRGGMMRAFLLADRVFRRHAFGTPKYTFTAFLQFIGVEVGDYFTLTHPLLLDFETGVRGVTNIVCEIIERRPNYSHGNIEFTVLDTRFMQLTTTWNYAVNTETVWPGSISPSAEMFICQANNKYSDGTAAREIF